MRVSALAALAWLAAGVATARADEPVLSSVGNWDLKKSTDRPANAPDCTLTPKQPSRIQVGKDRLAVSGLPKKSLFNYQYRIDDKPASTPAVPSEAMQDEGAVYLEGAAFAEILSGKRFQIRILDRWHEAVTEDVDLTGLDELHKTMIADCH